MPVLGISLGRRFFLLRRASSDSGLLLPLAKVASKVMIVGYPLLTLSKHGSKGACSDGGAMNILFHTSVTISRAQIRGILPSWC